mmetsp:Transcript_61086/g.134349  ORF Transcript_61086/g.134349 Transcript_61086/m.134349 type:complete len:227 (+) Transcript_61086:107-787(+)
MWAPPARRWSRWATVTLLACQGASAMTTPFASNLSAVAPDGAGTAFYEVAPARWNYYQPRPCPASARWTCSCPQPPGPKIAAVQGPLIAAPARGHSGLGDACSSVPPAPRRPGAVLLARRGACDFRVKVQVAVAAGYCGLLVANKVAGAPHAYYGHFELPDMTAEPFVAEADVGIPAWLCTRNTGDALFARLKKGVVQVEVRDSARKPPLASGQSDSFGLRDLQVI